MIFLCRQGCKLRACISATAMIQSKALRRSRLFVASAEMVNSTFAKENMMGSISRNTSKLAHTASNHSLEPQKPTQKMVMPLRGCTSMPTCRVLIALGIHWLQVNMVFSSPKKSSRGRGSGAQCPFTRWPRLPICDRKRFVILLTSCRQPEMSGTVRPSPQQGCVF